MTALLRIILGLSGLGVMALGLNVGLGGIATLGWQGTTDFFAITDRNAFAIQDNHVRFLAGVWFGVGLIMAASAFLLEKLRTVMFALISLIFIGGLARLSSADAGLLGSSEILPSLFAELVIFPLIGLWIYKTRERKYD